MVLDAPHKLTGFGHPALSGQCVESQRSAFDTLLRARRMWTEGRQMRQMAQRTDGQVHSNCVKADGKCFFEGSIITVSGRLNPQACCACAS